MPSRSGLLAVGLFGCLGSLAFVVSPGPGQSRLRATHAKQPTQAAFGDSGISTSLLAASGGLVVVAAAAVVRRAAAAAEVKAEFIPRPEDLTDSPKFPIFGGSTEGYFSKSTRERHAVTWTAKKEQQFEMPTGGPAIMNKGENLCYFRKKEQCITLGKQLRKMKIDNYKIYRLRKDGTVVFMHPADGVFPEKVNKGRVQVNGRPFSVGQNAQQGQVIWTKYHQKPFEADPLTTMFVKARIQAFEDTENLFSLPQPNMEEAYPADMLDEKEKEDYTNRMMEALRRVQEVREKNAKSL